MVVPKLLAAGLLVTAGAVAFWAGRAPAKSEPPPAVGSTEGPAQAAGAPPQGPPAVSGARLRVEGDISTLGAALERGLSGGATPQKTDGGLRLVESAAQREERHRVLNAKLSETLGEIPERERAQLIELNDEAIEVQKKQQAELMQGTLSHEDYELQSHQALLVQLDQLRSVVSDDEYRKLTGLEPGVDPLEYAKTGQGGAINRPVPPPTEATGEKHR